ncbi:MAG: hypothetical protein ACTSVI_03700 [Promethearchaeota archaeon]
MELTSVVEYKYEFKDEIVVQMNGDGKEPVFIVTLAMAIDDSIKDCWTIFPSWLDCKKCADETNANATMSIYLKLEKKDILQDHSSISGHI